jgi:rhodanese-related sulfurtransferase
MPLREYNFFTSPANNSKRVSSRHLISLLALVTLTSGNVSAQEIPDLSRPQVIVPEKISGVTTVTAEQLIEILMSENAPLLIDARIREDREFGYIESSISLPDIETNCDTLSKVSADKSKPLIFYCNGVQCGRSVVSIKVALSCGYHNLSWFKGGFGEWKEKGYQYIKND